MKIPSNKLFRTGTELDYIAEAIAGNHISGNGVFSKRCHAWLEEHSSSDKVLLTHSATGALEMAAILANIEPGDEVIMPSFTFVSTANAFVLRGAVPVFVDIRPDTLNIDETLIEGAVTPATRAVVPVHYAGVGCEMDAITEIAERHDLLVIEDAAQGIGAAYKGKPLGSIGRLAALSFHETKNIISGEGGALLINDPGYFERAETIWEKGTDRSKFFRGEIDKYSWVDIGSSFLPSDLLAAFLWGQLQDYESIQRRRHEIWDAYHAGFEPLEAKGVIRRPIIPDHCAHNAHLYYVLVDESIERSAVLARMNELGVQGIFHYVPLHSSPAGERFGRIATTMERTDDLSERLIRLPLWLEMTTDDIDAVIDAVTTAVGQ